MLAELAEPDNERYGVIASSLAGVDAKSHDRLVLREMLDKGFVEIGGPDKERRSGNVRKPYFITQVGKDYLDAANERAANGGAVEGQELQAWASRFRISRIQDDTASFLKTLPEFEKATSERIKEISQQLAIRLASRSGHNL